MSESDTPDDEITLAPEGESEATLQIAPEKELSAPRTDMTVNEMREWLRNWVANSTGQSAGSTCALAATGADRSRDSDRSGAAVSAGPIRLVLGTNV